jgi:aspartate/methionine/tyrosine aminotransferase
MEFSRRTAWDFGLNPLTQLLQKMHEEKAPILDLTLSNPTLAGFAYGEDALRRALSDGAGRPYEPDPRGLPDARAAVSAYYRRREITVGPERLLLTTGTSEAYTFLFKLMCDPGDEILVPVPSYPLFGVLSELESVRTVPYELAFDAGEGWRWDLDAIRGKITPRTRALVAISPNNPTGSTLLPAERAMLSALCRQRGLALIVDEVFLDYLRTERSGRWPSAADDPDCLTFVLSGLSKVAGLPQMKLSWIAAGGPGADDALTRLEFMADAYLSVGTPVQSALPVWLEESVSLRRQIIDRLERNDRILRERAREEQRWQVHPSEGGWYAVVELPEGWVDEPATLRLLRAAGVLTQPGFYYDFPDRQVIILSVLTPEKTFAAGIERLAEELKKAP